MKAYKRAWRARRRALGVCTTCGGARDVAGGVRCAACLAKDKANYERLGRARYQKTAALVNGRLREQRKQWERDGKCNWCGGPRNDLFAKRCNACLEYNAEKIRQRQAKRREDGRCPRCGKPPAKGKWCDGCNALRRAEYHKTMASNPDKIRAKLHRRRARQRGAPGHFTAADFLAIKAAQDYRCRICGRREPEITLTVDHVMPLKRGGSNYPENIQGLCESCNKSKGAKLPTKP